MSLNLYTMENLSKKELTEIGGGGIFNNNSGGMGISLSVSSDSLLSLTFIRSYGDYHSETTISVGNDINLGLSGTS